MFRGCWRKTPWQIYLPIFNRNTPCNHWPRGTGSRGGQACIFITRWDKSCVILNFLSVAKEGEVLVLTYSPAHVLMCSPAQVLTNSRCSRTHLLRHSPCSSAHLIKYVLTYSRCSHTHILTYSPAHVLTVLTCSPVHVLAFSCACSSFFLLFWLPCSGTFRAPFPQVLIC